MREEKVIQVLEEIAECYDPEKTLWAQFGTRGERDMEFLVARSLAIKADLSAIGQYYHLTEKGMIQLLKVKGLLQLLNPDPAS